MLVSYRITVEIYIIYNKLETGRCWRMDWTVEGYVSSDTHLLKAASYGCFSSNPDAKVEFPKLLELFLGAQVGCKPPFPKGWHWGLGPFPLLTGSGAAPAQVSPPLGARPRRSYWTDHSLPPSFQDLAAGQLLAPREPSPFREPLPQTLSLHGKFRRALSGGWVWAVLPAHRLGHAPSPPPPPVPAPSASARPHPSGGGAETLPPLPSRAARAQVLPRAQSPGALGAVRKRAALTATGPHARLPAPARHPTRPSPPPPGSPDQRPDPGARDLGSRRGPAERDSPGSPGSHALWTTSGKGQTVSGT